MDEKMNEISKMSYNELVKLYQSKIHELVKLKIDTVNYNFVVNQIALIEETIEDKTKISLQPKDYSYIKVTEKARELGISPITIRKWIKTKQIDGYKIKGKKRNSWFISNNLQFIKVTKKAKELDINPRTVKKWILEGRINGRIIKGKNRKVWLVEC